jgi:outer membrane protein OmpA-like peptidoglycan-associated protein
MVHRYGRWVFLVLICVGILASGCTGIMGPKTPPAGLQAEYDEAKSLFQQATDMGAKDCAPYEYAEAQVWLDYADHEWSERHWDEVAEAIAKAKQKATEAIEKCTPREVAPPAEPVPPGKPEFAFAPVYFDVRKADIRSDSIVVLDRIGTILQEHAYLKLEVAGHTDSGGSEEANMEMSLKRAKSVSTYLIDHFAISPHRLKVIGYGESRPVADNSTTEGRRMNRRVEFRSIEE